MYYISHIIQLKGVYMAKTELFECRYCYKKKMKSEGQICTICNKLFGKYVITIGNNNEKTNS